MSDTSPDERRHFTRIPMDGRVTLSCDGREWQTQMLDISLKGALLQRPAGYEGRSGDSCSVTLQLEAQGVTIAMQGSVAHCEQEHLGFHCEHIDLDSISHLKRLVELNLGDEALLERELTELAGGD
jgi:hypothetical protein